MHFEKRTVFQVRRKSRKDGQEPALRPQHKVQTLHEREDLEMAGILKDTKSITLTVTKEDFKKASSYTSCTSCLMCQMAKRCYPQHEMLLACDEYVTLDSSQFFSTPELVAMVHKAYAMKDGRVGRKKPLYDPKWEGLSFTLARGGK